MAGPIVSVGKPWLEALFLIGLVFLGCMLMTPETANILLHKISWFGSVISWVRHEFGMPPR